MTPPREEKPADTTRIQAAIQQRRQSRQQANRSARKRQWRRYTWIGTVVIGSLLLLLMVWLLRTQVPESFTPEYAITETGDKPVGAYRLYFLSHDGSGLSAEARYLPRSGDFADDAETVLAALFAGSSENGISPWPAETTVQDLYVSRDGVAYINFGASLKWLLPHGDLMEWTVIASLTRTLCDNFSEVGSVRLLIDGQGDGLLREVIPLDWEFRPSMFGVTS